MMYNLKQNILHLKKTVRLFFTCQGAIVPSLSSWTENHQVQIRHLCPIQVNTCIANITWSFTIRSINKKLFSHMDNVYRLYQVTWPTVFHANQTTCGRSFYFLSIQQRICCVNNYIINLGF